MVLRLLVMGLGLGVIAGTGLKLLAPKLGQGAAQAAKPQSLLAPPGRPLPRGLDLGRFEPRLELTALSNASKLFARSI